MIVIEEQTLDDILMELYPKLLSGEVVSVTKGKTRELRGALLKLNNPRARLSISETKGTYYSCLGEFLWYLAGNDSIDFISYYIPKYGKIINNDKYSPGAYGPRIFGSEKNTNQIEKIVELLADKSHTRQAVVQIYSKEDLFNSTVAGLKDDIPCTCTFQFFVRDRKVELLVYMRSNDAYKGLPHDIFSFTMIQEIVAKKLSLELGSYTHIIGSLHIYEDDIESINYFLNDEGWQSQTEMEAMPEGDPKSNIDQLLRFENAVRSNISTNVNEYLPEGYWKNIGILLKIFAAYKTNNSTNNVTQLISEINNDMFKEYIIRKAKSWFGDGFEISQ